MNKGSIKTRVARIYQKYWDQLDEAVSFGELDEVAELVEALYELEEILEGLEE